MDINDVLNNRDINFKQVDIAICPMCGEDRRLSVELISKELQE